jgi:hypothetical protein
LYGKKLDFRLKIVVSKFERFDCVGLLFTVTIARFKSVNEGVVKSISAFEFATKSNESLLIVAKELFENKNATSKKINILNLNMFIFTKIAILENQNY